MEITKKILIVDDNVEFCANVADVLELKGYETVSVYNGFDAIEAVKNEKFALILMDFKMPMMDGLTTYRKIREIDDKIHVIMISAYAIEDSLSDGLREGLFGTFKKPVDFKRLFSSIEKTQNGDLVLIADDDEKLCRALLTTLNENGFKGAIATDCESAIQMCRENKFDIILLNIRIAAVDGLKAFLTIHNIRPDVKIITITENNEDMGDVINQTLKNEIYASLKKPVNSESLLEIVKQALN